MPAIKTVSFIDVNAEGVEYVDNTPENRAIFFAELLQGLNTTKSAAQKVEKEFGRTLKLEQAEAKFRFQSLTQDLITTKIINEAKKYAETYQYEGSLNFVEGIFSSAQDYDIDDNDLLKIFRVLNAPRFQATEFSSYDDAFLVLSLAQQRLLTITNLHAAKKSSDEGSFIQACLEDLYRLNDEFSTRTLVYITETQFNNLLKNDGALMKEIYIHQGIFNSLVPQWRQYEGKFFSNLIDKYRMQGLLNRLLSTKDEDKLWRKKIIAQINICKLEYILEHGKLYPADIDETRIFLEQLLSIENVAETLLLNNCAIRMLQMLHQVTSSSAQIERDQVCAQPSNEKMFYVQDSMDVDEEISHSMRP